MHTFNFKTNEEKKKIRSLVSNYSHYSCICYFLSKEPDGSNHSILISWQSTCLKKALNKVLWVQKSRELKGKDKRQLESWVPHIFGQALAYWQTSSLVGGWES